MAKSVVLDSSAILAFLYEERGAEKVFDLIRDVESEIAVSTVNLCEVATKLALDGGNSSQVERIIRPFRKYCISLTTEQALFAGELVRVTRSHGLSMGDRACLALAAMRDAEAWTADAAWMDVKIGTQIVSIRAR